MMLLCGCQGSRRLYLLGLGNAVFALLCATGGHLSAQAYRSNYSTWYNTMATTNYNNMIIGQQGLMMQNMLNSTRNRAAGAKNGSAPAATPTSTPRPSELVVGHDPKISQQVRDGMIGSIGKSAGQSQATAVDHLLGDVQTTFGKMVQPYGLRSDNLTDVMTAYMVVMWMSANRQTTLPPIQAVQAVRRQVSGTMGSVKLPPSAGGWQPMAEVMMYQTCLAVVAREQAVTQSKPEIVEDLGAQVDRNLQKAGLNMRQLALNDTGFAKR